MCGTFPVVTVALNAGSPKGMSTVTVHVPYKQLTVAHVVHRPPVAHVVCQPPVAHVVH